MEDIKLFLEGFVIGLGKIMPGVSGSVMAICFGVYERLIACFSSIKNLRKNSRFFLILAVGIGFAILVGSNIIKVFLDRYLVYTVSLFVGMMIPGIFSILKNVKNSDLTYKRMMLVILVFFGLILLNTVGINGNSHVDYCFIGTFISLFLCGILDAAATIIPGISGSALLMIVGYYEVIIASLASPFSVSSLAVLFPFLLGLVIGVILISKLITYLFKNYRAVTYMLIITFALFSVVALEMMIVKNIVVPFELVLSIIFVVVGGIVSFLLERLFNS